MEKLEKEYAKLLHNYRRSLKSDPTKKLKTLQKRLEDLFQLLSIWSQYVEIIYMPESEVNIINAITTMEARPEDTSYAFKTEEKEISRRISTLFGKDPFADDAESKKTKDRSMFAKEEEAYETVNEGMTTDTTEASEKGFKRGTLNDEEFGDLDKSGDKNAKS